jgi:predicted phage terminase large subunit-like protein
MFYDPPAKVHKEIYRLMNDPSIKILEIILPRSFAKTTLCQGFLLQQIVNKKHNVILYVGDTGTQAEQHTDTIRYELEDNEKLIELYGEQRGTRKWGSEKFTTIHGVTVIPRGSNQSIRGAKEGKSRPSLMFLDDMENDENCVTIEQRDKLWNTLFAVLIPILDNRGQGKDTKIIYLGTPMHEDSVLLRLYDLINRMRAKGRTDMYAVKYSCKDHDDQSIWPTVWPNERIDALEAVFAEGGKLDTFWREYYCEVISPKGAPFKKEDTHWWVQPGVSLKKNEEELPDGLLYYAGVDVAFKEGSSNDYSAIAVVGVSGDTDKAYVVEAYRKRLPPDELLDVLEIINKTYMPIQLYLQKVTLDEFFAFYAQEKLKDDCYFPFESVSLKKGKGGKPRRILSLQPLHLTGQLVLNRGQTDLQSELYAFPRPVHDDISDILATILRKTIIPMQQAKLEAKLHDPNSYEAISAELRERYHRSLIGGVHNSAGDRPVVGAFL